MLANSAESQQLSKPLSQAMKQLSANEKLKHRTPLNDGSSNYEDFSAVEMRQIRQGGFKSDQDLKSAKNEYESLQSKELDNLEINSLQSGSEFQVNPASSEHSNENEQTRPILATPEKTQCYLRFDDYPVRIEGPEYQNDYTYYLIDKLQDLTTLERGIPLSSFCEKISKKRIEIEFRTLAKICFHKDHVLNLFQSLDVKYHKVNRHPSVLPFIHNRVVLRECGIVPLNQISDQNFSAQTPYEEN